ncbi:hypothetical protein [Streptomyces natalensis]|uniref:hypothetical protein n=1 Tax=Streptomyces natalensis TaxID=68242 RepID=UPI000A99E8FB|nr:hypothetical protein [Streptomyces natalensis]
MTDFDPDDIRAMRKQGDFKEFMRQQIATGKNRREVGATQPPAAPSPGRRPGAWPPGTRPPSRPPAQPDAAECSRALAEYREWLEAGANLRTVDPPCPCPACRRTDPRSQT